MSTREKLLKDLNILKAKTPLVTDTMVGKVVANDGGLIPRLRSGTDCNSGTSDKIDTFIKFTNNLLDEFEK